MLNSTFLNSFFTSTLLFSLICSPFLGFAQNNSKSISNEEAVDNPVMGQSIGCTDFDYCFLPGSTSFEWLDSVQINDYINPSGGNEGYELFEDITEEFEIEQEVNVRLSPGYSGYTYNENFLIFIDSNQDGEFGMDEVVFNQAANMPISGTFIIPEDALLGSTRMRVLMNFNSSDPIACPEYNYDGETEDYCITIKNSFSECLSAENVGLTSFQLRL